MRSGAADLPRRAYLKDLLSESMRQAVDLGVSPIDAVSLVGWGLFWRFLVDRNQLVRKTPSAIAEGAESWTECLSTKGRALKTLRWLDATFNGGLLPFETSPKDYVPEVFSQVLGNIAAGATPQGQLRLPTDWDEIDFSHVPVGLLSEVYEAFATALDTPAAKKTSIHYTPGHIAEFVIGEALEAMPDVDRPRVLDPAVGAGVAQLQAHLEDGVLWRPLDAENWYSEVERLIIDDSSIEEEAEKEVGEDLSFEEELEFDDSEGVEVARKSMPRRIRAARSDASVGSIIRSIERIFSLPEGSVVLCGPDKRALRRDARIGTLRRRWED